MHIERTKFANELDISYSMKYSIPAIKITQLCVFNGLYNKGVGTILMTFVNILALVQQKKIGCRALIVDSKPEAVEFYKRFNFVEINKEENSDTIFMVNDIGRADVLGKAVDKMITFCKIFGQDDLVEILRK